jgi:hypothetical protein
LCKLAYCEDVVMSRRGGAERTPTLIFNTYRLTGDRLEKLLRDQDIVVGRVMRVLRRKQDGLTELWRAAS